MTPPWGTPPETPARPVVPGGLEEFLVVGFYGLTGERFAEPVTAATAREAEERVTAEQSRRTGPHGESSDFNVCAVVAVRDGRAVTVDDYAWYLDPAVPAPAEEAR